ncbi:hypothetical protein CAOG_06780 [Capsaspora owczarzaki ATCC 30864]|uniref:Uncharacterized protein n=1 Tax=Capsaspora owczarzaki (strain ATCC 30864) TaxID=595528 RepID=A0A0D2X4Q2_CAPO3|nr:hypothetical protein CAOG_06780 [Capsaspora owczarzaki ATCC 30864]KJE96454.1 hypothetical protein CAOG_006780 [Capsaspora owczarzaki ATCC 30864]|eukprot:XP_004344401.1 hypothetical protein CAOG_06780 [Capsaspora owczarzaki ATCC 30864]
MEVLNSTPISASQAGRQLATFLRHANALNVPATTASQLGVLEQGIRSHQQRVSGASADDSVSSDNGTAKTPSKHSSSSSKSADVMEMDTEQSAPAASTPKSSKKSKSRA